MVTDDEIRVIYLNIAEFLSKMFVLVVFILCIIVSANGMAVWMTKDQCEKELAVGVSIMGFDAVLSDERRLIVFKDKGLTVLKSGDKYYPNDDLYVMLAGTPNKSLQFVFEATNAVFDKGGCNGRRVANVKSSLLILPSSVTEGGTTETLSSSETDIQLVAGWAESYGAVKVSAPFVLSLATPAEQAAELARRNAPPETNLRSNGGGGSRAKELMEESGAAVSAEVVQKMVETVAQLTSKINGITGKKSKTQQQDFTGTPEEKEQKRKDFIQNHLESLKSKNAKDLGRPVECLFFSVLFFSFL
jgi:hypothetical protein